MPTLPTYQSKRNIEPRTSQPLRNEASQIDVDTPFKDQQKLIGTMQKITQAWSDAHDVMQYTTAKNSYEIESATILAEAKRDTDFSEANKTKYSKRLQDAKSQSLQGIDNRQVMDKLAFEFDYGNQVAGINIESDFMQKELINNQFVFNQTLQGLQQKKLASGKGTAEAMEYERQIKELIQANVLTGTISKEDAAKAEKDAYELGVQYEIYADQATREDDSDVLKELRDPKGKYKDLAPEARLDLIKESQNRISQNFKFEETIRKDKQTARNDNIIDKLLDKSLTVKDLDDELKVPQEEGALKRSTILKYKKGLQTQFESDIEVITKEKRKPGSKKPSGRATKAQQYLKLIDNFVDDEFDSLAAREKMAEIYSDGILNPGEMKFLNSLKKNLKDIEWNRRVDVFKNVIEGVKSKVGLSNPSDEDLALNIKALLGRLAKDEDPLVAQNAVVSEHIESEVQKSMKLNKYIDTDRLEFDEALDYLNIKDDGTPKEGGLITVVSSSGKLGQARNETGLEGVHKLTLDDIIELTEVYNIPVTITGLTETGHAKGARSHGEGWKADLRSEKRLNKIIESWGATKVRTNKGKRENGYVNPRTGSIYWREGNHWDIEVYDPAVQYTEQNVTFTMEQNDMTRQEVLDALNVTEADIK